MGLGFWVWGLRLEAWDPDLPYGALGLGSENGIWDLRSGIWVWQMELWVWGSRSGVWSGVLGLGSGI